MIKAKLQESIMTVLKKLGANVENVEISYPTHSTQGDFSTNVAFKYARQLNKNPLEFANEITKLILKESIMTVLKKLGANVENVEISYPTHSTQGDFSTNVAFKYARQL